MLGPTLGWLDAEVVLDLFDLTGMVAIVTGSSRGIDRAISEALVIAVPDAESAPAVIALNLGAAITLAALNASVEKVIAPGEITGYARLDRLEIVEQLPSAKRRRTGVSREPPAPAYRHWSRGRAPRTPHPRNISPMFMSAGQTRAPSHSPAT